MGKKINDISNVLIKYTIYILKLLNCILGMFPGKIMVGPLQINNLRAN